MSTLSARDGETIQTALTRSAQAIQSVCAQMPQLRSRMAEWERGAHRSSSIPEAISHNGDPPVPESDPWDRKQRDDMRLLRENSLKVARYAFELERTAGQMRRLVHSYLNPSPAVEEEEQEPCQNIACTNWVRRGERTCARCRQHKCRFGRAWPERPVTAPDVNE